jgi:hypothetical protein
MKRIPLLLSLMISGFSGAIAQTTPLFNTSESIDIGNIKAAHLVHGDMWWDPATNTPRCEYPKGSGKHVGFTSSLWMAGLDQQGILQGAAQTFRDNGSDFWPGPVDSGGRTAISYASSQNWARIWKLDRSQLDSFQKLATHTTANTPLTILEWPAIGNPYAKGAGGVSLTITRAMAPFVDVNSDGVYNPLHGDYPKMKGDQMLWWIINDNGPTPHYVFQSVAIGLEVQITAYAYHRSATTDNIIFYEYLIKSHSGMRLEDFRVGLMSDLDLGDAADDYTGFDSSRRMGLVYNGKPIDGTGQPTDYGSNPPMSGVAIMEMPGDAYNSYQPAGSYTVFNNSMGPSGSPANGQEMYRLMNSFNRAGTQFPGGNYMYTLDSECIQGHTTGDRRFVISTSSMTLYTSEVKIGMALVVASGGGCPSQSFTSILQAADTALEYYWNPPATGIPNGVTTLGKTSFRLFPNPVKHTLYLEVEDGNAGSCSVYNTVGQLVNLPVERAGRRMEINTSGLATGVYILRYTNELGTSSSVFTKE